MARRSRPWIVARPLAVALVLLAVSSSAGDTRTEAWPEGQAFFKLGGRVRLHLLADVWYAPAR